MSETILDNAYRVITRSTQQDFVSILSCYVNPLYENARPDFRSAFLDIFGVDLFHIPFEDVANWYADHSRQFPRPQVVSTGISTSTVSSLTVGHSAGSTDPTTDSSGLSPARSD